MKNKRTHAITFDDRLSSYAAVLIGAIHITVLAVTMLLAFMASQAFTQIQAPACSGNNILLQLAQTAPEKLAEINAEAAKVPFGDGLLFKLEKDGRKPSYLFGTMHMTDPRVVAMPLAADTAFENADIIAVESTEILDPAKAQVTLMSKPELTMFTGEERLSDFLDEEGKAILSEGLADRGMQLALIDRMKPWLLTGMLALPECEFSRKQAGEPFLDMALAQRAVSEDKRLVGLETLLEQFDAMASLPMKFHVQGLIDTVALGDQVDDVIETMIVLYSEGKIGAVWPLLRTISEMQNLENPEAVEGYAAFEETMVVTRNKTMLERSLPLLEQGNAFIAVGALHLPGKKGLAQLYEDAGYEVSVIK